jgi:glycosyltransferase involved in cell wall biosynthesis
VRILILSPVLPYPPASGFAIRVYQFARLLARAHEVTLLAYSEPGGNDSAAALARELGVTVHTVTRASGARKRVAQLLSVLSPSSYQRRNAYSDAMQQKLADLTSAQSYDVIQIETSPLVCFDFGPRALVAVVEHDIVYELLDRMSRSERALLRRLYNRVESRKVRREEIRTWRTVSACLTTSDREKRIIGQLAPATPILVAPNAVDVTYFHPSDATIDPRAIVMTGFMKTRPNIDAAVFMVHEILPRILAARPETILYVVGGGAPDEVKRLTSANVVVTDTVPDVRPYVHKASVFVVPLRIGGGTRLKVLEGLSMRKPMVSTSLGCEGIDVRHREHLLVADDPDTFARAVLDLLENRTLAERLAATGRELVERQYRWETVVQQVPPFYEELLMARADTTGG